MYNRARGIEDQLIKWRREFHSNPELGFQEVRTSGRVAEILEELGYRVRKGVGKTGVVAEIGEGNRAIAIRADMDALPIQEANDVPYRSREPGVMHACGHDAHTAMALGAAALLKHGKFQGRLRFLFQPAEEVADEKGVSGAPRMVADGAIDGVDSVVALHVDATLPVGKISVEAGPSSAGVDTFYATIIGRGGHGAAPHRVVDPIHIAGHVILALHGIVSRRLHPVEPAVVSIGSIHGGQADNVIPEEVEISGTIRYMARDIQKRIHKEIERSLKVARTLGGNYKLKIEHGYPPMYNDAGVVNLIREVGREMLGTRNVQVSKLQMGAEDFGFFCQRVPGAMFSLGCRIEKDERKAHSPRFDIDERCLPIGTAILAQAALRFLGERNG